MTPDNSENNSQRLRSKPLKLKRQKMVGWYDPLQLLQTAKEVVVSAIFGKHADGRLVQALHPDKIIHYDYSKFVSEQGIRPESKRNSDEFWFDYVSDVGDGWNSTYAVAHALAQNYLKIDGKALLRGELLIMGGDEVYPAADSAEYTHRLEHPYSEALKNHQDEAPHLFAIPGNHDWYDSLASFTRIFCDKSYFPLFDEDEPQEDSPTGVWYLPQQRSYFAIKLPHDYWLIGVDLQLGSDLDYQQIEYLKSVNKDMNENTKIVLFVSEPYWIYKEIYEEMDATYKETRLSRDYLEEKIFKKRKIVAYVAGDLHHYYRLYDEQRGVVKITAGGGGAFLHPTHGELEKAFEKPKKPEDPHYQKFCYPPISESKKLTWGNFFFLFRNWKFGALTALVYFLAAWSVLGFFSESAIESLEQAPDFNAWLDLIEYHTIYVAMKTPVAVLWAILIFSAFLLFTDTHKREYRIWGGGIHGLTHLTACLIISWFAHWTVTHPLRDWISTLPQNITPRFYNLIFSALMIFVLAWVIGSCIMGLYLFISLNVFKRHSNEAFSSLANQDWKHFLRMKIDANGLTIYPIGINRVPRNWREATPSDQTVSAWVSDDAKASAPILIEAPILLK